MTNYIRNRGLLAVHANIPGARQILAELQAEFNNFKDREGGRIENLERGIDDLNSRMAAMRLGGSIADDYRSPDLAKARAAVVDFMRTGNAAAMRTLTPQAAMSTDNDPAGGYMVPVQIDAVIQSQLVEISPMRRLATIASAGTSDYKKLINRRGASSGWVGERETRAETDTPLLAEIKPPIGELYAQPEITTWMAEDSQFNLDNFLQENVSDEFSVQEGAAFVTGDGIEKPRGFLSVDTAETADASRTFGVLEFVKSGVAAALSDGSNNGVDALKNLLATLKPSYRAGPGVAWQMNATTANVVSKLKDSNGNYLWQPSNQNGQPDRLLGYEVALNEEMPDIGANAFPIAVGNWRRGYIIVDRSEMRVLRDPFTKKGWVRFYFTKRVGGSVADSNAIKLLKIAA